MSDTERLTVPPDWTEPAEPSRVERALSIGDKLMERLAEQVEDEVVDGDRLADLASALWHVSESAWTFDQLDRAPGCDDGGEGWGADE